VTTTRKQTATAAAGAGATVAARGTAGRAWMVGGGVAAGVAVLTLAAFAVYRYRRCYEGSYSIDAELPMNGYIPSRTCGSGSETATMNKRNGGIKPVSHCSNLSRSSKELYV